MLTKFAITLAFTASVALAADLQVETAAKAVTEAGSEHAASYEHSHPHQSSAAPVYEEWKDHDYLDVDAYENRVLNDKENAWVIAFVAPTCPSCHTLGHKWDDIQASTRAHE